MTGERIKTPCESKLRKHSYGGVKILNSQDLFENAREILIQHHADCYRLMITKSGKLILNK